VDFFACARTFWDKFAGRGRSLRRLAKPNFHHTFPAMKNRLLSLLTAALAALFLVSAPAAFAQEEDEPQEEERAPMSPEEFKKFLKEREKANKDSVQKMLKVFKALEGEWTGTEKIEHTQEEDKPFDKEWKDEWKGFYTFDGMYFEMTGQTQGDEPTQYRWVCTWDTEEETYKAWYFGVNGQNNYTGELSEDGKYVIWTTENEDTGYSSRFSMIPDGDRVKCDGKDRREGRIMSRQSSSYTRKKVAI
jgi:hypothetical protein